MVRAAIINDDLLGASWFANVFAVNGKSQKHSQRPQSPLHAAKHSPSWLTRRDFEISSSD